MNRADFSDLPVVALSGLEGNDPAHLTGFQPLLAPHVDLLIAGWTALLGITAAVLIVRGIVIPFFKSRT